MGLRGVRDGESEEIVLIAYMEVRRSFLIWTMACFEGYEEKLSERGRDNIIDLFYSMAISNVLKLNCGH